jgi:hypothetical protein
VLNRHFKAGGPRYEYLPFDVAAGTQSVTISYSYTGNEGASVIDLGLFEPGPLTLGTPAFRGYSGGAQRTIVVGRNHASSGYKTGPLPPGQWHVMLGMYKVAPAGVDVQVTIAASLDDLPQGLVPGLSEPAGTSGSAKAEGVSTRPDRSARWYSGGLHFHTTHSDGAIGPAAVADAARAAGLDFFAITDHNNTTHTRSTIPASPLRIVGEELTTPGGHATVWGLPEGAWIDFRVSPGEPHAAESVEAFVAQAHAAGALFGLSHPVDTCPGCSWDHVIPEGIDAVEIWQDDRAPRAGAVAFWDRLLRNGRHVTAIGVSDWHRPPSRVDVSAVRVLAGSLTQSAILDGIRRGHVIVMRDAQTAPPSVRARCGSTAAGIGESLTCAADEDLAVHLSMPNLSGGRADFIWNAARMTSRPIGRGTTFTMPAAAGYLRVHVFAADGSTVAITNPIYVATR